MQHGSTCSFYSAEELSNVLTKWTSWTQDSKSKPSRRGASQTRLAQIQALRGACFFYISKTETSTVKKLGWSEPAATSAPVQDEAVQAILGMNQKHILFSCQGIFQPPFSAPKFSPPTYFPPSYLPPSPHFPLIPSLELERAPELE
jgi:hypothetical protein